MATTAIATDTVIDKEGEYYQDNLNNTFNGFIRSVHEGIEAVKNAENSLDDLKNKVLDYGAEDQAQQATEQGVVSIADALRMIRLEKEAKEDYKNAEADYMKQAANMFAATFDKGLDVLSIGIKDIAGGVKEYMADPKIWLSGAAGAIASLTIPEFVRDKAEQDAKNWTNLENNNEIDKDVDAKYLEGYENAENTYNTSVIDSMTTALAYDPGKGEDAIQEKIVEGEDTYTPPAQDEAVNITDSELETMSNLDSLMGEYQSKILSAGDLMNKVATKDTIGTSYAEHVTQNSKAIASVAFKSGYGDKEESDEIDLDYGD